MVYIELVKRVQIYIEPEMDRALAVAAARERTSKAALIRRCVAEHFVTRVSDRGTLDDLVGVYDEAPESIDEVVYGR